MDEINEIKEVIAMAMAKSVNDGKMMLEQVPIPYQEAVGNKIEEVNVNV